VTHHPIDQLDAIASKHWRLETVVVKGIRRYRCSLWAKGNRVSAYGGTPGQAIIEAISKTRESTRMRSMPPTLKLTWTVGASPLRRED